MCYVRMNYLSYLICSEVGRPGNGIKNLHFLICKTILCSTNITIHINCRCCYCYMQQNLVQVCLCWHVNKSLKQAFFFSHSFHETYVLPYWFRILNRFIICHRSCYSIYCFCRSRYHTFLTGLQQILSLNMKKSTTLNTLAVKKCFILIKIYTSDYNHIIY